MQNNTNASTQAPTSTRKTRDDKVRRLTLAAMLTALVVVLQLLGSVIHIGIFSINLSLVPIVVGAAKLGVAAGAWLGFVSAAVILLSGDAAPFMSISVFGTIATVILKGVLSGLCAALVYKLVSRWNKYAAIILAGLTCPVVNTGIFVIGCRLFFWDTIQVWAAGWLETVAAVKEGIAHLNDDVWFKSLIGENANLGNPWYYVLFGLVGANFLIELAINAILAPAVATVLGVSKVKNTAFLVYGIVFALLGLCLTVFSFVAMNRESRTVVIEIVSIVVLIGGCVMTALGMLGLASKRRNRA